jgi:hypothetical protein
VVVALIVTFTVVVLTVGGFFEFLLEVVPFFAFLVRPAEEKPEMVSLVGVAAVTLPLAKPTLPAPPNPGRPLLGGLPDPPP